MGCSNPHPHGQIWSGSFVPEEPATAFLSQKMYFDKHGKNMLQEYARQELKVCLPMANHTRAMSARNLEFAKGFFFENTTCQQAGERVVCENDTWMCVVPFWALWPFEAMILPKPDFHFTSLADTDDKACIIAVLDRQAFGLYHG
jgi:UDPglucose--hexose-1-phosphate uridylyltransferase